ncbi:hypothetical protein MATR_00580 [Marivirga tractuosa]|uniref:Outer membrane protein beta-barrel domain-containing protein n=2 Tax=Marivirga TaxID=869806 RepID=E4TLJ6_MARTH|nr:hypothetical protein [Marivirga tractuosa]ADR22300.1 hypothetical protein Ftrac_2322 [Marivirga tractuosa DSM 4126]BDD13233.1 hypothetical protein MATR_00580 [Marivirga tractuosa]
MKNPFLTLLIFALLISSQNLLAQTNMISFKTYFESPLDEQKDYFNTATAPTLGYYSLDSYKRKTSKWGVELGFSKAGPATDTVLIDSDNNTEKRVYKQFQSINLQLSKGADFALTSRFYLTYGLQFTFRYVTYDYNIIKNNYVNEESILQFRAGGMPKAGLKFRVFKEMYIGLEAFYLLSINSAGEFGENTLNSYAGISPLLSVKF